MQNILVTGTGMTPFGRFLDQPIRELAEKSVAAALRDSEIDAGDVDCAFFGNAAGGLFTGQECIRGQVALRHTGLQGKPIVNVENACASGSTAFYLARLAIQAGECDIALVVGAEKMYSENRELPMRVLEAAADLDELPELNERIAGPGGAGTGSVFMDLYSSLARAYIERTGATARDFALVARKSRQGGSLNPDAQFRDLPTVEFIEAAREISPPLTLPMCSSIGDGAAALVLMSAAKAKQLSVRGPRVMSSVLLSGEGDNSLARPVAARAALEAYDKSGVGPEDLDVVELHDAAAPAELWLYEQLGFAAEDGGPELLRSGRTHLGGDLPVNPSGGLLSRGHAIGATGCAQLVELVRQLNGRCGARQVPGAKVALAENGGGWIGSDAAATVVTILAA